ncbi:Hypothetical predicted protein [Lecanosticta acicola]|uniref:F-box domain-containing protein n=1 Tax=Lecanosticta acicola TaxID=111012 RepID=A0AAI8Z3D6_9PEZI|nr:Hypothetical predicted protein [Lecanosticta acicola]
MSKATLFSLPGELRNAIWRELVTSAAPLDVEPLCEPDKPRLKQPAAAFTCKQLRDEVLSIFYSENTFYLGKIGYHHAGEIRLYDFNRRLARWREMLGPYTKYLTHLSMIIDGQCYAWDEGTFSFPGDAQYEIEAEREGRLRFEMNGRLRCTCRLKNGVVDRATRDGRVLLDVMQEYSASYFMLLKLPGELRNQIIRLAVLDDHQQPINLLRLQWTQDRTGYSPVLIAEPALSRTCRALRREALSIYYAENLFHLGTGAHVLSMNEVPQQLQRWTQRRLREYTPYLRNVRVEVLCEILGPKAKNGPGGGGGCFYRDFWEILQFSVSRSESGGAECVLRGDPTFEELCVCDIAKKKEKISVVESLALASRLWFSGTTELQECGGCGLPRLSEVKNSGDGGVGFLLTL